MSDTDLMGCTPCKGRGKLLGLGSIQEDCSHCKGIGWVEKLSDKDFVDFFEEAICEEAFNNPMIMTIEPKKKAGRPKRISDVS